MKYVYKSKIKNNKFISKFIRCAVLIFAFFLIGVASNNEQVKADGVSVNTVDSNYVDFQIWHYWSGTSFVKVKFCNKGSTSSGCTSWYEMSSGVNTEAVSFFIYRTSGSLY